LLQLEQAPSPSIPLTTNPVSASLVALCIIYFLL
jgi:hypothetical protein